MGKKLKRDFYYVIMSKMSKKQMSNTEFHYLIQYLEQALNWQLWVKSADDLLAAAGELEPSIKRYWAITKENLEAEREKLFPLLCDF